MCDQLKYNKITEFIDEFLLQDMNKIFLNDIYGDTSMCLKHNNETKK